MSSGNENSSRHCPDDSSHGDLPLQTLESASSRKKDSNAVREEGNHLQMMLGEQCETVFRESEIEEEGYFVGNHVSSSQDLTSDLSETTLIVKDLDTGKCHHYQENVTSPRLVDPRALSGVETRPWANWWKEVHLNNEELWTAAEKGTTSRLYDLLFPEFSEDGDGRVSSRYRSYTDGISQPVSLRGSEVGCSEIGSLKDSGVGDMDSCSVGPARSVFSAASSREPMQINSRSIHGRTALHIAASNGQAENVQVLLASHANVDMRTDAGFTALHLASERGFLNVVALLLEVKCDLAAQTKQGDTAFHLAAAKGHAEVLCFLLEHRNDDLLCIRNNFGQRPLDVCQDMETHDLLHNCVRAHGSHYSCSDYCKDSYASRTPYDQGSVLLRNSRTDAITKLLFRSAFGPGSGKSTPADNGKLPRDESSTHSSVASSSFHSPQRVCRRPSFSTLRRGNKEVVGPESFELKSILGKGSFGEVYQVVHRCSGEVYAMKVLLKNKVIGRNLVRYARTERNLLSYIRHPFIVRMHYAFQTPSCLVLVLQYCPGGNLSELLTRLGRLHDQLAQLYFAEILLAIEYLHERKVIYRDLKAENIVLDQNAHAMLTDFGLSKEDVEGFQGTNSFCGSVAYLAPEILSRKGHGHAVDIYGLGVLLHEMLVGRPPFYAKSKEALLRNILSATLSLPSSVSNYAASLIRTLLNRDPTQRLGALSTSDIRHDPYLSQIDFDLVLSRSYIVSARPPEEDDDLCSPSTKVSSPFEGRLESKLRRSWSWATREIAGWEFATAITTCQSRSYSPPIKNSHVAPDRSDEQKQRTRSRGRLSMRQLYEV